jgi:hypothetical protein
VVRTINITFIVLLGTLAERLSDVAAVYNSVGERLIQIRDAPRSPNGLQVYDPFAGAYRYFLDDREVDQPCAEMRPLLSS